MPHWNAEGRENELNISVIFLLLREAKKKVVTKIIQQKVDKNPMFQGSAESNQVEVSLLFLAVLSVCFPGLGAAP